MPRAKQTEDESQDARRGYGEGQLIQKDNGMWYGRVSLGYGPNGKRVRKLFTGKTQRDVKAKMRDALQAQEKGLPIPDHALTVKTYMEEWIGIKLNSTLRPRTKKSYEQIVRLHIIPSLGKYKLTLLDAMTVDKFIHGKIASGLSTQTAIYIRRVFYNALEDAMAYDKVARNVVALTKSPERDKPEKKVYTEEDSRQLLLAFSEHRHGPLYTTLLGLGLRLGEGLGLRWTDLELDCAKPYARIQVQLQFLDREYKLTSPKTETSQRTIYIPQTVVQVLRDHKIYQDEVMKPLAGEDWSNQFGLVFTNINGGPLDHARVRQQYKVLLEKHNITCVPRLHDLRHMAGSLLISRGVHPRVIQEMLGHSTCILTLDRYSHVNPRDIASAADALDGAFGH